MPHDWSMSASGPGPILPPATIGILGGGQLGRMLGYAARALGYGIRLLDPDPGCPASVVADDVEVGGYDDLEAALRLARDCAVVTYELEHVAPGLVDAIEALGVPVRPGARALRVTQDRLAERRFVVAQGVTVAPWREVTVGDEEGLDAALEGWAPPARLKAYSGGTTVDHRSVSRPPATGGGLDGPRASLGQPALLERRSRSGRALHRGRPGAGRRVSAVRAGPQPQTRGSWCPPSGPGRVPLWGDRGGRLDRCLPGAGMELVGI